VVVKRLAIAALVLAVSAAHADAPVKDWSQNIETVVVTAHKSGPLLWRVSKGDASVVIVALVEPWPKDLAWDQTGVRTALQGARELLLPPGQSEGMVEGLWFLTWHSDAIYLPDDTPMESTISPGLRARFAAAREKIHQDAGRYSGVRVPLAGLRFEGDFLKSRGLTQDEPTNTLKHLAWEAGVPSRPVAEYEAFPMLKRLPEMSAAANETCLKASLDDADTVGLHAVPAAQAWAKGDLDGVEAHYSELRFEACIQAVPGLADLFQRAVNDSMNALNDALTKPGKTVMVASLGEMLRKNGILDRLGAERLSVEEY
jgi:hypothetical protein